MRLPLGEGDIKTIKRNLDRLDDNDQLLVRLLASTGMRLGEAFEIDSESKEHGVRYVIVGRKTEQSKRRVPLPAAVLSHIPRAISQRATAQPRRLIARCEQAPLTDQAADASFSICRNVNPLSILLNRPNHTSSRPILRRHHAARAIPRPSAINQKRNVRRRSLTPIADRTAGAATLSTESAAVCAARPSRARSASALR